MSAQPPPRYPQQPPQYPPQYSQPQYPPPVMWYPAGVQPPKKDNTLAAIIIVVVVLVIVLPTVLAGLLYWMVAAPIAVNHNPRITFGGISGAGNSPNFTASWIVSVAAEPTSAFTSFKGQILMDGVSLTATPVTISAGAIIQFGTSVRLIVTDFAGEGKLTAWDEFLVYGMSGVHSWSFHLLWAADGTLIQTTGWTTP